MSTDALGALTAALGKDRELLLGRSSTAERVAGILRDRIMEGFLPPGTRLSEEALGGALGVSRNTLREAFRLLAHEKLLDHELNRGVFVRTVSQENAVDLYRVRGFIETAAVRSLPTAPDSVLQALSAAAEEGERAAEESRWADVGTANMHFHQAIVALSCSPRLEDFMQQVLAELRLVFHVMEDPRTFHEPYLRRNRKMLAVLQARDAAAAEQILKEYLTDAENEIISAYKPAKAAAGGPNPS
ncbi:GntR family transcriptional regulator [Streptomyces sp. NBC_01210]|uniref:GntR family transcriptional regulator n=1 Tax=Streptomyces sp. NBC_01210 TaxID=2903774 RepID=UPI002E11DE67|nr:GntR family transcriptional regulator [Streptomyces sp. NBC_01210]